MLNLWNDILPMFHRVNKVLQNQNVNLKHVLISVDNLLTKCGFQALILKDMKRLQTKWYQMLIRGQLKLANLPERRYSVAMTEMHQKYIWTPEIMFVSLSFTQLLTNLKLRWKEEERYTKKIGEISFLSDVPHNVTSLIDVYQEDLNTNFSAALQQFHSHVRHTFSATQNVKQDSVKVE